MSRQGLRDFVLIMAACLLLWILGFALFGCGAALERLGRWDMYDTQAVLDGLKAGQSVR